MGGFPTDRPELARLASPLHHVRSDACPFLILHGEKDRTVIPAHSRLLHKALTDAGVSSELHILPDAAHGGPAFATPETIKILQAFLTDFARKPQNAMTCWLGMSPTV